MEETGLKITGLEFVDLRINPDLYIEDLILWYWFRSPPTPQKTWFLPQSSPILINGTTYNLVAQAKTKVLISFIFTLFLNSYLAVSPIDSV